MPLYMDRHDSMEYTPEQVAAAHEADLEIQQEFGVRYLSYWFQPVDRTVFCLADGPSREAVIEVHRKSHGLLASRVIEVDPSLLQALLGEIPEHPECAQADSSGRRNKTVGEPRNSVGIDSTASRSAALTCSAV